MQNQKVFITYNTLNHQEKNLALRMHTIGAVNGFTMLLPDRFYQEISVSDATKHKIVQADWFVLFAMGEISNQVAEEINFALQQFSDTSRIIVVHSLALQDNFRNIEKNITLIPFNPYTNSVDTILREIKNRKTQEHLVQQRKNDDAALLAFFGIGLGLLALAAFKK